MRKVAVVAAAIATVTVQGFPADATTQAVVAGPAASAVGFATPVVTAANVAPVIFVNADQAAHNVAAVELGPDTNPWCGGYGGGCPLFATVAFVPGMSVAEVQGVSALAPGSLHAFKCTFHGLMTGTLVVV
jgi:plastocyanin